MSQIYQRPETYMMVAVQQDANLRFGNVALPAYFMKLMALPSLVGPVTNLRNTILIQAVLQELLGIKPNRGVIIYVPVPEDSFATNGATAMGEIARLEREGGDPGILKTISRGVSRRLKSNSTHSNPMSIATTASWVNSEGQAAGPRSVGDLVSPINSKEKPRTVKKTKSIREFVARRLTDLGGFGPMAP